MADKAGTIPSPKSTSGTGAPSVQPSPIPVPSGSNPPLADTTPPRAHQPGTGQTTNQIGPDFGSKFVTLPDRFVPLIQETRLLREMKANLDTLKQAETVMFYGGSFLPRKVKAATPVGMLSFMLTQQIEDLTPKVEAQTQKVQDLLTQANILSSTEAFMLPKSAPDKVTTVTERLLRVDKIFSYIRILTGEGLAIETALELKLNFIEDEILRHELVSQLSTTVGRANFTIDVVKSKISPHGLGENALQDYLDHLGLQLQTGLIARDP